MAEFEQEIEVWVVVWVDGGRVEQEETETYPDYKSALDAVLISFSEGTRDWEPEPDDDEGRVFYWAYPGIEESKAEVMIIGPLYINAFFEIEPMERE